MDKHTIIEFYANEMEEDRLETDLFKLEGLRTKEIISRYLSKENMQIADIGGGAGYYAFWLQVKGHPVSLVDLSPKHIELVGEHSTRSGIQLASFSTGDATALEFKDGQFDLVLLLGPLYHLVGKADRLRALSEARRILKPGGIVLTAVISRYASLMDGFKRDLVRNDDFEKILCQDLQSGVHLNETGNPEYFTTAYLHTPAEIKTEISASGLHFEKLIAIESFGWIADDCAGKSRDSSYMKKLFALINLVESNDDLIAMSPHIMAVATKK
jgi:ubiquinone/menaquinone biosynthesis C-methylase UbiE